MVFVSPVEALSGIHRFGNTRLRTLQCRLKSRPFQIEIFRKTKTVCKENRSELWTIILNKEKRIVSKESSRPPICIEKKENFNVKEITINHRYRNDNDEKNVRQLSDIFDEFQQNSQLKLIKIFFIPCFLRICFTINEIHLTFDYFDFEVFSF